MKKTLTLFVIIFLIFTQNIFSQANAGPDQDICDDQTYMQATDPAPDSGLWTVISGSGTFADPTLYNSLVTDIAQGTNVYRWEVDSDNDDVTITNNSPTVPNVQPDIVICTSSYTLQGTIPGVGETGLWTNEFGAQGVIVQPTSYITAVHSVGTGANTFRWTISNALCSAYDDIVITNNSFFTNAGSDQSLCTDTTVLAAYDPAPGTGYWTVIFPPGVPVFDNSLAYNTVVTNLALGTNTFRWTATNGGCNAEDDVTISNNNPSFADAGVDQTVCDGATNLAGNNPSVGTGVWTLLGGAGTIANPSQYNTLVTNLSSGVNTFGWTIINNSCESSDNVLIINDVVFAYAGMDAYTCGDSYTPLKGNQPGVGETGIWAVLSGSGVIDTPTLYNSGVTGLSAGENRLRWTITSGACQNSDIVSIFNNSPTEALVGDDQEICIDYSDIYGNPPVTGVGEWSVASGSGQFDNSLAYITTVRNILQGTNTYRWTITNGACSDFADITIINNSVTAIVCDTVKTCGTEANLYGNAPLSGETGIWSVTAGTGIIADNTLYNTAVSNLNVDINIFRWTISKGNCSDYADLVVINNLHVAYAGIAGPTVICDDSADLFGNIPVQGCTGEWSVIAGCGYFDDPNSPTTSVYDICKGENTYRWTVTKEGCSNYDDVVITNNMVVAMAGNDQISCGNDVNLSANELLPGETGLWTLEHGSGTILTPSDNETIVTNLTPGTNGFKWTVWGNGCVDFDEVQVFENSFNINAGPAQTLCSTVATLAGEYPAPGTGLWTTGSGVTINDPTLYNTTVTGLQDNSPHIFKWTVIRNTCTAWDEVVITNNFVHAYAGEDQIVCTSGAVLSAENPIAGAGYWTLYSGNGTIVNPSYYASELTDLGLGANTLTWTVMNQTCVDADAVIITRYIGTEAYATDQTNCNGSSVLDGNVPGTGETGLWNIVSGSGTLSNMTLYNSVITDMELESVSVLRWTMSNENCSDFAEITVINNGFEIDAGPDDITNTTSYQLNAEDAYPGSGLWSVLSGMGIFSDNTLFNTTVTGYSEGDNIFRWTVTRNSCIDDDDVTITYDPVNIDEHAKFSFSVYPNPTNGLITISSSTDLSDAIIELTSISGQEVYYRLIEKTINTYGIDLSHLAKGIYFLKINIKGQTKMIRLVKK